MCKSINQWVFYTDTDKKLNIALWIIRYVHVFTWVALYTFWNSFFLNSYMGTYSSEWSRAPISIDARSNVNRSKRLFFTDFFLQKYKEKLVDKYCFYTKKAWQYEILKFQNNIAFIEIIITLPIFLSEYSYQLGT